MAGGGVADPIWMFLHGQMSQPRIRLQLKILFVIKALPIPKKNWKKKTAGGGAASTPRWPLEGKLKNDINLQFTFFAIKF